VLASLALLEVAVRRPLWQAAVAALTLSLAYLVNVIARYNYGRGMNEYAYGQVFLWEGGGVVIPLLLGAWLRLVLLRAKERRLRDLREAREAERTEIARELHDLVAHHVASMALRVGIARAVVPDLDPRIGAVLDDVHTSARTALADLRRLVSVLRDPSTGGGGTRVVHVDPADLPAAVTEVIDRGTRAGIEVTGHVAPLIATLDAVRGLAVLRLVQEGLTNVAKHAAGARAMVRVDVVDGETRVEVTDDGGVPGPLPATESGYGLIGLRERVEVLGGTLTAGPGGDGWRLHATLPTP
jgi:signal transduction histidine kinase